MLYMKVKMINCECWRVVEVDERKNIVTVLQSEGPHGVLDVILNGKDARSWIDWLRSRFGGIPLREVIQVMEVNHGKSFKDETLLVPMEVRLDD